ncbi:MAG: hypothetical protein ACQGVC_10475 [Myxococcota bacterium]
MPRIATPTPGGSSARRNFLLGTLRVAAGLALLRPTAAHAARTPGPLARPDLSTRRIAGLGERLAREDRPTAERLAREVAAELPLWLRLAGTRRRMQAARRLCLDPRRVAADLDAGRVLRVDGWILARSEVALAAWAHQQT